MTEFNRSVKILVIPHGAKFSIKIFVFKRLSLRAILGSQIKIAECLKLRFSSINQEAKVQPGSLIFADVCQALTNSGKLVLLAVSNGSEMFRYFLISVLI